MTEPEYESSLEDQLLIAMPQLADPYFSHTVTYIWKHNQEGALGIVINKPLSISVADIFDELEISCSIDDTPFKNRRVLAGGPVERDKGFIIHDSPGDRKSSLRIGERFSLSTSKQLLQEIADGRGPERYLVALGCAGWDGGQLEQELGRNAWLTAPASAELVFSEDFANKAAQAAAQLGIDMSQLSPDAGHS
ncbi:MAG: YqgE/AlgH family protein [Gammaproteobacteria bacterium]|nr:YqgE/AlgH family protein [Pseudomonadales bacterium]MCP5347529.1 YqgE/AlgH family protein [Pseudomonadales bacterium]